MRKLGAQGGREWDEGKAEQLPERGSQYRRGAHGGVVYDTSSSRDEHQGRQFNESRERKEGFMQRGGSRGRGDRGRGGRGRGNFPQSKAAQQTALDPVNDFPALPAARKNQEATQGLPSAQSTSQRNEQPTQQQASGKVNPNLQPTAGGESWADQVDQVQEAKAPKGGR